MLAENNYRRCVSLLLLTGLLLQAHPAASQQRSAATVNWAYASYFGSGWYKINSEQSAFIAHFSPTWLSGRATALDVAGKEAKYTIRVPLTVGVTQLDLGDVPGILDPDNLSTASIGLSADIDVPLTERFSIRPNIEFGYGTVLGESADAFTYKGDIRGRYRFEPGRFEWAIIGAAGIVAYDSDVAEDDSFTYASLGAEFAHPLPWFRSEDSQTLLYWHVAYTDFFNRIRTQTYMGDYANATNYWQAGIAFGKKERPIKFWFFKFDRLGLAYDISPAGDLRGINLVISSLYEPT